MITSDPNDALADGAGHPAEFRVPAAVPAALVTAAQRMTFKDVTRAVRTRQWAKNALLFPGFVFAGLLRSPLPVREGALIRVLLAFICFCALSGTAYLINDWLDIERDRAH